ncbi:hypothetical protein [Usitatibacter palustris]|uniref:Uncharacterized protein n=1 Tax=Usitatibacter palustris TaxID=2732487 RepID=A0A6M4HFI2_9PROT|nr:hypothetical protein [Usitatibacter palustris]QJR16807.1 hypothetical protein DSM104440_03643 [Usitatibacter palustris]
MGIKDWFGGDKKKAEFREEAKKLATGPLTPKTAAQLEKLREDHGIEDAGDDKTVLRREIYNTAAKDAQARGKLSAGEAAELAKIQKFLALRDDQVDRTKQNLSKLRVLTEIRQGRIPVVPKENAALRQVQFQPGEIAHYAVQVEMLDRPTTSGRDGVAVKWGKPYVANSAKVQGMPLDGARSQGEGYLILTNQRLIFKSGMKPAAAIAYSPQAEIHLYAEGLRLQRTVGNTLLVFKSQSEDTAEIVGELLAALMRDR